MWDQIVDVVDNYFDIQTEQRMRQAGEIMTVGRIDTAPKTGSTFLEPWRGDGADQYEKAHNTLQTIRRRAVVQVVPAPDVFQIEVTVFKELEDLKRPEYSTAGSATFRNDGSLIRIEEPVGVQPTTEGWIPLGRDAALEQAHSARDLDSLGSARRTAELSRLRRLAERMVRRRRRSAAPQRGHAGRYRAGHRRRTGPTGAAS
ncbi:MAG: hypothetical protein QM775_33235 [Pirellulales bacterium]